MRRIVAAVILAFVLVWSTGLALAQTEPTPVPAPEATPGPPIPKVHFVADGETLTSIAGLYGTTVERLLQANNISDPAFIFVGQAITIPDTSGDPFATSYVVQLGDNLADLAAGFNTTAAAIAAQNHLLHPSRLVVGEALAITSLTGSTERGVTLGAPYVVRPGESLLMLAAQARATPAALAQLNELSFPYRLYPGQRLRLPGEGPYSSLPGEWTRVALGPLPAAQGRSLSLYVENLLDGEPTGEFRGQPLRFAPSGDGYVTVIGLDAFAETGVAELVLGGAGSRPWVPFRQQVRVQPFNYGRQELILPPDRSELLDPELVNAEIELLATIYSQFTPVQQWSGLYVQPILTATVISADYGIARSYNGGPYSSFHSGTDYAAFAGTAVTAPATGTVVISQTLAVRGNTLIIDHGLGVMTGYYHLSRILVGPGEVVSPGQPVAEVGNTGLSTGPHLHWDLRIMNMPVDPLQWTTYPFP